MSPAPEHIPDLPDYSPDPTLTPQQHRVLSLLAEGLPITNAAAQTGIHRNTIRNWRRSVPAFAREMEFAVREQALVWHEHAVQRAPKAARIVDEILDSPDTSPSVKLRAALALLKTAAEPVSQPLRSICQATMEIETAHGQLMAWKEMAQQNLHSQDVHISHVHNPDSLNHAQSCTTLPIRKAPEPGRNSPCPCKSGLKWKRCCGDPAQIAQLRESSPLAISLAGSQTPS